jgi:hypothetical protein
MIMKPTQCEFPGVIAARSLYSPKKPLKREGEHKFHQPGCALETKIATKAHQRVSRHGCMIHEAASPKHERNTKSGQKRSTEAQESSGLLESKGGHGRTRASVGMLA